MSSSWILEERDSGVHLPVLFSIIGTNIRSDIGINTQLKKMEFEYV